MPPLSIRTEEVSFVRDGEIIRGFAAWPSRTERLPALVIIPDVHGLSDHYRGIARRFAAEGFFSFALDLYSREGQPQLADLEAVTAWIQKLDDRRVLADVAGAVRFLRSRMEVRGRSIGVTGFCLGGQYALMAACSFSDIGSAASFYGMLRYSERSDHKPASPLDLAPHLHCPYLGMFGGSDLLIPTSDVDELKRVLRAHGKVFAIKVYPDAGHAFFNDGRPDSFRPEAASDAWKRVLEFFRDTLAVDMRVDPARWRS